MDFLFSFWVRGGRVGRGRGVHTASSYPGTTEDNNVPTTHLKHKTTKRVSLRWTIRMFVKTVNLINNFFIGQLMRTGNTSTTNIFMMTN